MQSVAVVEGRLPNDVGDFGLIGFDDYVRRCDEVAASGYEGFHFR